MPREKVRQIEPTLAAPARPGILDTLQHGDCLAGMRSLPDGVADVVFADPPFNIGRAYEAHDDKQDPIAYLRWTAEWAEQAVRVTKPTGSIFVCASEEYLHEIKVVVQGALGLAYREDDVPRVILRPGRAVYHRHDIVWHYTFGVNAPKKLTRSHTTILHFVKSRDRHRWFPEAVRIPSARQEAGDKRASPEGRLPDDTWMIRPAAAQAAGFLAPGDDVMLASRVCGTFRERAEGVDNQMPEQLVARIFRLCACPGDLVVSPFVGSGTDLVVAKKLGLHYLGWETSAAACAQAMIRLESAIAGDPLDRPDVVSPPTPSKCRAKVRKI